MKRNRKKVSIYLIIAILVSLLYGMVEVAVTGVEAADYGISNPYIDENGISTWNCIYFGKYWQNDTNGDGVADENDDKEPIKWRVLSINGDDIFLLAENGLDCKQYNETYEDVTWENCTLRKWLNDTFLNTAFSLTEQEAIRTTEVINDVAYLDADRCGNNTSDKIFLLSVPEAIRSSYGFWSNLTLTETRACKPTEYAKQKGAWSRTGLTSTDPITTWNIGNGGWWLRTPGYRSECAAAVMADGYANAATNADKLVLGVYGVGNDNVAIRPALHISISSSDWEKGEMISACSRDCEGGCGRNVLPNAKMYDFPTNYTSKDSDKKPHTGEIRVKFDENELSNPSNEYNHNIATFCSILSTMAYDTSDGFEKLMDRMDYDYGDSYVDEKGDSICYSLANKTVQLGGEETDIVLAVMRGTYNMEWVDNFDPGTGKTHKGFQKGADVAYSALKDYISEKGIGKDGRKVKIIVTGHSRGAAVANLLGKEILDKGRAFLADPKDLFDYSFATPNSTSLAERNASRYDGIFSIVNPEDFVTKVMLSKKWDYGRYGQTLVLPSSSTDNKLWYESYLSDMRTNFCNYRTYDYYEPYKKGMNEVSTYIALVGNSVPSVDLYYYQSLYKNPLDLFRAKNTLQNLYTVFLGYNRCGNSVYEALSYANVVRALAGEYGGVGFATAMYFIENGTNFNPRFAWAHYSETYLAAMKALDADDLYKDGKPVPRKEKHFIVNCPVDISITDKSGSMIAEIKDNEIVSDTDRDSVTMAVVGESKQFWLSGDEDYFISLTGNAEGEMDYILAEEDADSGESERVIYKSIPISDGKNYASEIFGGDDITDVKLEDTNGNIVNESEHLDKEDLGKLSVKVSVEGVGTADSYENLSYGDSVVLSAITDKNNSFLGWYDSENNLLTTENEYSVVVTDNQELTAKFTDVVVMPESVTVEKECTLLVGEERYLESSVSPDNVTCSDVVFESDNEDIVSVTEDGIVKAVDVGEAYITVKSIMDESVQNVCKIVVQSNSPMLSETEKPVQTPSVSDKPIGTTAATLKHGAVKKPSSRSSYRPSLYSTLKKPKKVTLKKVKALGKRKVCVTWKWFVNQDGFQLQYAQNKKFTKKKKTVKKNNYTNIVTLKKLKKGRTYYFRVRAYNKSGSKKKYGKWSNVKKVKIK